MNCLRNSTIFTRWMAIRALALVVACLGAVTSVRAGFVNDIMLVDFNANGGSSGTFAPGSFNGIGGDFGDSTPRTDLPLFEWFHQPTDVTLSFSGQNGFFDTGSAGAFASSSYASLMDDYVYTYSQAVFVINGLTPNQLYGLTLWDSAANVTGRDTVFTVNGASETVQDFNRISTFVN